MNTTFEMARRRPRDLPSNLPSNLRVGVLGLLLLGCHSSSGTGTAPPSTRESDTPQQYPQDASDPMTGATRSPGLSVDAIGGPEAADAGAGAGNDSSTSPDSGAVTEPPNSSSQSLQLDCSPRYQEIGSFTTSCERFVIGDKPGFRCNHAARFGVGGVEVTILEPARIVAGTAIALDSPEKLVSVSVTYATTEAVIQTETPAAATGTLVFDSFALDGSKLSGRFADAVVTAKPAPPFKCKLTGPFSLE